MNGGILIFGESLAGVFVRESLSELLQIDMLSKSDSWFSSDVEALLKYFSVTCGFSGVILCF